VTLSNCLALTAGLRLGQGPAADHFGLSLIYERILTDLVLKMRTLCVDRFELGCLRIIVLFNPGLSIIVTICIIIESDDRQ